MIRDLPQRWALPLMLLSLHGVMLWGFDSLLTKTLLLSHYGLFLLWQPIWRGEQQLSVSATLLFLAGGALLLLSANWWVMAFWEAALFGLLGGRVFSTQEKIPRMGYLVAASYLLAMLMMWVTPKLLIQTEDIAALTFVTTYAMPLLPLSLLMLPGERTQRSEAPPLDFFYSLLLFLLAVILLLGSFAIQDTSHMNYFEALTRMLFILAAVLFLMSWLWNPRAGFSGIGYLMSRYLLSVGMPFEQWLGRIARLAEIEPNPMEFLSAATKEIDSLPWVSGGEWHTPEYTGRFGTPAPYSATFSYHDFEMTLHARQPLTPVLTLHIKLLTQLLGEFHEAKKRENALREQSYMRAVYETGARLTHDIKNLVQSMSALCAAAQSAGSGDQERLVALIQRQLPQLNRRLELTLEKLQSPKTEDLSRITAAAWWDALMHRYQSTAIDFSGPELAMDEEIYAEVFDNVVDNLLQNALEKARHERGIRIRVALEVNGDAPSLEVSDTGSAMAPEIAQRLFKSRIDSSESGLGIGLYHAARQAQRAGYTLSVADNENGRVRFTLVKTHPAEPS